MRTILCDNTAGCQGDGEKADTTDLLSGPTMWLGAQDGRYGIQSFCFYIMDAFYFFDHVVFFQCFRGI